MVIKFFCEEVTYIIEDFKSEVMVSSELTVLEKHSFKRCVSTSFADSEECGVYACASVHPCGNGVCDGIMKVIMSVPLDLFRKKSAFVSENTHQLAYASRNTSVRERVRNSEGVAGTDLQFHTIALAEIIEVFDERNDEAVNIGSCHIFQVTTGTDPVFKSRFRYF